MSALKPARLPAGYFGWSLLDGDRGAITLKDALYNLSASQNGDDMKTGRGILIGVVSCLIAGGMTFDDACQLCCQLAPSDIHPDRVPPSWREHFVSKMVK